MIKSKEIIIIIGTLFGDEGKGRIIDNLIDTLITSNASTQIYVARAQGGDNAGHTIYVDNKKFVFHNLPSAAINKNVQLVIGNGCVINLNTLLSEIEMLKKEDITVIDRLHISSQAHVILNLYKLLDALDEEDMGDSKIGTTKKGIGYTYSFKMLRKGIRMSDLKYPELIEKKLNELYKYAKKLYPNLEYNLQEELDQLMTNYNVIKSCITDTSSLLINKYKDDHQIIIEGAQATFLDIDQGMYPYCTSSNCTVSGVFTGLGIPPFPYKCIGVSKAYVTRVGNGPFITEIDNNDISDHLITNGHEFGSTTGRKRRVGWLDMKLLSRSNELNNYTSLAITKLDIFTGLYRIKICINYTNPTLSIDDLTILKNAKPIYIEMNGWTQDLSLCKTFEELPENTKFFIKMIEELTKLPVQYVGVGADRSQLITRF